MLNNLLLLIVIMVSLGIAMHEEIAEHKLTAALVGVLLLSVLIASFWL